ncbi:MAG: anti-sigma factor family protein [Gaiellales bacterium]
MSAHARSAECTHAERCMQSYVDRALSPDEVAIVEQHLAVCSCCAKCYGLEAGVRTVLKDACDEPCPDALRAELRRICDDCDCE